MGKVGNFGKTISFEVSDSRVLTFSGMSYSQGARFGEVSRLGEAPYMQFLGVDNAEISMDIVLDATLGVKPYDTQKAILKAMRKGEAEYLVIGGKKVGQAKFVISSVSEAWNVFLDAGQVVKMTLSVTFKQYQ